MKLSNLAIVASGASVLLAGIALLIWGHDSSVAIALIGAGSAELGIKTVVPNS